MVTVGSPGEVLLSPKFTYPGSFIGVLNSAPDHFWKRGQILIGFKGRDCSVLKSLIQYLPQVVGWLESFLMANDQNHLPSVNCSITENFRNLPKNFLFSQRKM